jgi:hypothetical protein
MSSLVYDVPGKGFSAGSGLVTYAGPGVLGISIAVTLRIGDLMGEFGIVPASIQVAVRVRPDAAPMDAWLDAQPAESWQDVSPESPASRRIHAQDQETRT